MVEVSRAITKHHYLVQDARDIARIVKEAFHLASTGPARAGADRHAQGRAEHDRRQPGLRRRHGPARLPAAAAPVAREDRTKSSRRSGPAQRPIIYCGGGVIASGAAEELREFAAKTGIPVAMTVHGLGAIPSDHYLSLNMLGMHGTVYANYAVNEADLLLAFGVRFDDRVTGKLSEFAKHGEIVHVDIDASEINKNKFAHIPVHTDVKIVPAGDQSRWSSPGDYRDWHQQIDEWRASDPMTYDQRDDVILPQYVLEQFSKLAKGEFIMTTGVGQHQMWAAQWTKLKHPRTWITSGGLGSMGYGLPAAMGAQAAFPDALVVDIDGDGSFVMNIQELATVHCEKLPVKVIVLNNQHLGMVVQWEDRFYAEQPGPHLPGPDRPPRGDRPGRRRDCPSRSIPTSSQIARGFGVKARHVRHKAEVVDALAEMIAHPGPYVLDVLDPLPGARPADDPGGHDGPRHHQELRSGAATGSDGSRPIGPV